MTHQTELRQLRELLTKADFPPLVYSRDGVYAGELVDCETGNVVDLDHEQMEAFAAMANACDAGLLDMAERGLEAEKRRQEAVDYFKRVMDQCLRDGLVALAGVVCTPELGYIEDGGFSQFIADVKSLRREHEAMQSQLTTLTAERDGYANECKTQRLLLDEVRTICGQFRAERDAAVAERDELRKDWCQKCGRKFATVNDFRALTRDSRAADGLCPTRYAFRDPDAQKDCDAASEARRPAPQPESEGAR